MNYVLINKMISKPGKRQEVIDILTESGKAFDNVPACLLYLVSESVDDPNVIWIQDVWTNKADHEALMKSESMQNFIKKAMPLLAGMPEQYEIKPVAGKSEWIS